MKPLKKQTEYTEHLEIAQDAGRIVPCRLHQLSPHWRQGLRTVEFHQLELVSSGAQTQSYIYLKQFGVVSALRQSRWVFLLTPTPSYS